MPSFAEHCACYDVVGMESLLVTNKHTCDVTCGTPDLRISSSRLIDALGSADMGASCARANSSGALAAVLGEPQRREAPEGEFHKQSAGSNGAGLVADEGEQTERGGLVSGLARRILGR